MADPLRRRVRAKALRALTGAASLAPPAAVRAGLWPLAALARFSSVEQKTLTNLRLAYGDELDERELRRIARGTRHHARELISNWMRLARSEPPEDGPRGDWIEDLVELDPSVEILHAQLALGRGAIVVTGHLGDWELLCARVRRIMSKGAVVGMKKRHDPVADWLIEMRRSYGATTLAQSTSPRELLRLVQEGGTLGLLCDLEVRRLAGEFLPFFGRPALTMTAPAGLARAGHLPLVPARCVKPPGSQRYLLSFEEPLPFDRSIDRKLATAELMGRVNQCFERWIRETPEQWAWHQPRWRTRPGELDATPLHGR